MFSSPRIASAATARPLSYSCVMLNGMPKHCYGIADWSDNGHYPAINGAYTDISVVHLSCPAPQCSYANADFIDDEIWVRDVAHQASSCPTYKVGCWVEAGIIAEPSSPSSGTTVWYFWADYRPGDSMLNYHPIAVVNSGDYGYNTVIDIYRTASSNCNTSPRSGTFALSIISETHSYPQLSQRNCMTPDDINIGQELQGTNGASAPTAHFTFNYWVDTNGIAHYQTLNPSTPTPDAPVHDDLVTPPSQSSTGGDFDTWCIC